jgi:hypothetical protein
VLNAESSSPTPIAHFHRLNGVRLSYLQPMSLH